MGNCNHIRYVYGCKECEKDDEELVPYTSIVEKEENEPPKEWGFTCSKCSWMGQREGQLDLIRIPTAGWKGIEAFKTVEVHRYPDRCPKCDKHRKRHSRMWNNLRKLDNWNYHLEANLGPPKMYTVGLVSIPDDPRTLEEQILEIKSKWKNLRNHLLDNYQNIFKGGISNVEVTHKVNFDREKGNWFGVKYHVHIHAAVLLKYIAGEKFVEFAELPLDFGLGRANIVSRQKGDDWKKYRSHLANYLAKYITKGIIKQRSIRFGIMDKRWRRKNDYPIEEPIRDSVVDDD